MAAWGALVFLLATSLVVAFPSPHQLTYPENARRHSSRIVSGWEANDGEIPYQLSLRMVGPTGTVSSCGATLIDNEWALTAAHCTANRVTIVIRAGGVSLLYPDTIFETTDYYNHPLYIESLPFVQPHDIGVIRLNRYIEYSDVIQPIRLQPSVDKDKNYADVRLQASGWGRTWTNGASPTILNWVYLLGVSNEACREAFGGSSTIVDSTICASGYNVTSQSTCQGDSGGPLVTVDTDGELTQVGLSSFVSSSGCHTDFPAGFIRPGHYHEWFYEITGKCFDSTPCEVTTVPTTVSVDETTAPDADVTTAAPEEDGEVTTSTPEPEEEEDVTTSAPEPEEEEEEDVTTSAPVPEEEEEEDVTTSKPEEEEDDEDNEEDDDEDNEEDEDSGEDSEEDSEEDGEDEDSEEDENGEDEA